MTTDKAPTSPMLKLLASGLQLWVRQRCQRVESLEVNLQGSALALLRGRIEAVQLLARRSVYQHLPIEQVDVLSEAISVQIGNLLKGQPVQLEHPFAIRGQLSFSAEGLTTLFSHPHWRGLTEQLQDQVLGQLPLAQVRIDGRQLIFDLRAAAAHDRVELPLLPRAADGTIELCSAAGEPLFRFAMDPAITIERVWIEAGMVQLQGRARVSP